MVHSRAAAFLITRAATERPGFLQAGSTKVRLTIIPVGVRGAGASARAPAAPSAEVQYKPRIGAELMEVPMQRLIGNRAICLIGAVILLNGPALAIDLKVEGGGVAAEVEGSGGVSAAAIMPAPPPGSSAASVALPSSLVPRRVCLPPGASGCDAGPPGDADLEGSTPQFMQAVAMAVQPGAPPEILTACRNGIIQAALPYDPVRVDAVSAGDIQATENGGRIAPLVVRIVYDRQGGYETREAEVACHVDAAGAVVSLA